MKLGLDLWGVILSNIPGNLNKPRVYENGAIEYIRMLSDMLGSENVFIVSLIKEKHLGTHLRAFKEDKLLKMLGIPTENVNFVFENKPAGMTKAPVIQELGITHFVDDQMRILANLPSNVKRFWYASNLPTVDKILFRAEYDVHHRNYPHFNKWDELFKELGIQFRMAQLE